MEFIVGFMFIGYAFFWLVFKLIECVKRCRDCDDDKDGYRPPFWWL